MSVSVNNEYHAGLPLEQGEAGEAAARRILLVEEQAHVVRVIRHNLERCGFHVDSVESADGALQLMMSSTFDALIMTGERPLSHISDVCRRGADLLAAHATCEGKTIAPLMLVSCGEDDDLADELPGFERLDHPVSLKQIVERLHVVLGEPELKQTA